MKNLRIFAILIVFVPGWVFSQSFYSLRQERSLIGIVGLNSSTFLGDLSPKGDVFDAKPSLSVGAMYYVTPRIAARAELSWVTLAGKDVESEDRAPLNLSFTSNNFEFALTGMFNLFPLGQRFYQRPKINFYAFGGIGISTYNPMAELNGTKYALRKYKTEGVSYGSTTIVVPMGGGVRFMISPMANISFEAGLRKTFTDYMDDVSTVYLDYNSLTGIRQQLADRGPEIGRNPRPAGSIRGNPDKKDAYILYCVKLEYYLPSNIFSGATQRKLYNRKRKAYYRR